MAESLGEGKTAFEAVGGPSVIWADPDLSQKALVYSHNTCRSVSSI